MADSHETQLVVLGGGPGGYAAAFLAADRGMQVTLIDAGPKPGGACLHVGCIPVQDPAARRRHPLRRRGSR